jgi:hypothetical protein
VYVLQMKWGRFEIYAFPEIQDSQHFWIVIQLWLSLLFWRFGYDSLGFLCNYDFLKSLSLSLSHTHTSSKRQVPEHTFNAKSTVDEIHHPLFDVRKKTEFSTTFALATCLRGGPG